MFMTKTIRLTTIKNSLIKYSYDFINVGNMSRVTYYVSRIVTSANHQNEILFQQKKAFYDINIVH